MKKAVKFLPATAAAVAVMTTTTTMTPTTNNNVVVDAFSIHPTATTSTTLPSTTTNTLRKTMTVSKTVNRHGPFCTCYGCTSTSSSTFGGSATTMKLKLSSSFDDDCASTGDHPSCCYCDCPACSSGSSFGIREQQRTTFFQQKSRFGMPQQGSLCDCDFCRQRQQQQKQKPPHNRHGLGCSCSQCMKY